MNNWFRKQLNKRIPASEVITLDYRKIFIFPSKLGIGFVGLLLVILLLAINYQNNLMFGFCFLLAALVIISIFSTFNQLHGLKLENLGAQSVHANQGVDFSILGTSTKSRVHDGVLFEHKALSRVERTYFDKASKAVVLHFLPQSRGVFIPGRLKVSSSYPFGLIKAWTWVDLSMSVLIYAKSIESKLETIAATQDESGESQLLDSRGDNDLAELKSYTPGDNLKHIAWKQFAKGRGLYTKHYADMGDQQHFLIDFNYVSGADIEAKLSAMTYWTLEMENSNHEYAIKLPDYQSTVGSGASHLSACLDKIALFGLADE